MRRVKTGGKTSGKGNKNEDDPDDLSSCSEEPEDSNDGDNGDLSPYYCRHCYATSSRDWHHAGKEKLLVCLDCRLYFKKYGELPCLEATKPTEEEDEISSEEEDEDIKPPVERKLLDLNAIEQDSSEDNNYSNPILNGSEPVEIKGELSKSLGLVSPVPTMPAHMSSQQPQSHGHMHHFPPVSSSVLPPANLLPGPPPAHANNEVQILSQQPQLPQAPREPSPPPKPDGSECHRSQSAIFTRQWNRGEGNSCSRTDLFFKPVPDSKLARKREERLRKANEREDAMKAAAAAQEQAAKVARMDLNPFDPFGRQTPSGHPGLGMPPMGSPYMSEMERMERERAAMNAALAAAAAGSPRSPYPNPPGTPGPPGGFNLSLESRRIEEMMARARAEQNYADRISALATDPLVRLQLAGVNPEIPGGGLHPAYASLMASLGPRPPPGFDPRFRSPAEMMLRPPPGFSPRGPLPPDFFQRQLLLEREHNFRAASAQQHASLMAQQEEFLRMEQEARVRQQQASVSRP